MFGVGLHFSIADLLAVRRIAIPGAIAQIAVATGLGALVSRLWGWPLGHRPRVRALALGGEHGRAAPRTRGPRDPATRWTGASRSGWLIVEDLVTVLALVLLPALAAALGAQRPAAAGAAAHAPAAGGSLLATLAITLLKVVAFVVVMLVGGRRVVPWLLGPGRRHRSRELFTLAVLAIALGIAVGAAALFDVSFALGAFFAGVIVSESDFSHEAADERAAAAGRLRGAVLRLGRDALRPDDPRAPAARRCWPSCSSS